MRSREKLSPVADENINDSYNHSKNIWHWKIVEDLSLFLEGLYFCIRKFRMPLWHSNILMYSGTHMLLYTVKSQIESATLFKIWHFWWDYNRVRIIFEWGLYYLIWVHEHMSILECPRGIGNLLKNMDFLSFEQFPFPNDYNVSPKW